MNDMKTYEETLKDLRAKLPDDQYVRVMYQPYCELSPEFLGFVQQYEIISELLPKDWKVIDLGCNAAAQCFFFTDHEAYIGVDILADREADPGEIMNGRLDGTLRFRGANTTHYEADIGSFINVHPDLTAEEKTIALCIHVPDEEAVETARDNFRNVIVYDPERPVFCKGGPDETIMRIIGERLEELREASV